MFKLFKRDNSFVMKDISNMRIERTNPLSDKQIKIARKIYEKQELKFSY